MEDDLSGRIVDKDVFLVLMAGKNPEPFHLRMSNLSGLS